MTLNQRNTKTLTVGLATVLNVSTYVALKSFKSFLVKVQGQEGTKEMKRCVAEDNLF